VEGGWGKDKSDIAAMLTILPSVLLRGGIFLELTRTLIPAKSRFLAPTLFPRSPVSYATSLLGVNIVARSSSRLLLVFCHFIDVVFFGCSVWHHVIIKSYWNHVTDFSGHRGRKRDKSLHQNLTENSGQILSKEGNKLCILKVKLQRKQQQK
jgi:hypothetical protein